jgi:hypothetical protein
MASTSPEITQQIEGKGYALVKGQLSHSRTCAELKASHDHLVGDMAKQYPQGQLIRVNAPPCVLVDNSREDWRNAQSTPPARPLRSRERTSSSTSSGGQPACA